MEFPDDVLRLIREFSNPCFKYFREYNRTMQIMGVKTLPKLKACLETEPERILPALHVYDVANLVFEETRQQYLYSNKRCINYLKHMDFLRTHGDLCEAQRNILRLIHE
jgi:hypothetical protein